MLKGQWLLARRLAMGTMLAAGGNLTGNDPADPATKIWLGTTSLSHQDQWGGSRTVEPLNVLFAATADLFEAASFLPEGDFNRLQAQLHFTFAKASLSGPTSLDSIQRLPI